MTNPISSERLGATLTATGCAFRVWAPSARQVDVHLTAPSDALVPMLAAGGGYHHVHVDGVGAGARYRYRIDSERERPDPASALQPDGVHDASEVVDPAFPWTDERWRGRPLESLVIYELHVGTYAQAGTFEAVLADLDRLVDLGVTAIELMPVGAFPGARNWGYDGVYPFAVQHSYGGPRGLKALVDGCHHRGVAVLLDVVYNHLGPEGNYLWDFGPYFTDRYRTPWGDAVNFDGPGSDGVRHYFIENALRWVDEFHLDGLRLDALHAIYDLSAEPFIAELADAVRERATRLGRRVHLIGECDRNDVRVVRPRSQGGHGLDAQWSDDFHHALHALLTGEQQGYYQAFGSLELFAQAARAGYAYRGQFSPFRGRRFGSDSSGEPPSRFVVFSQNHDQIGNRPLGERLSALASGAQLELAAAAVILSPFLPLLFMGEEYGERAPFLYFSSHADPALVRGVRRGRQREARAFGAKGRAPDPQAERTFARSRIDPSVLRSSGPRGEAARRLHDLYRTLLRLRREHPVLQGRGGATEVSALDRDSIVLVRRWRGTRQLALLLHFGGAPRDATVPLPAGRWRVLLDTADRGAEADGARSTAPFVSDGGATMAVGAYAALLCEWEGEAR